MASKTDESEQVSKEINESSNRDEETKTCGLIMPLAPMISSNEIYTSKHWEEVKAIVTETVGNLGFDCKMVSEEDVSGSIHTRIVTNIYKNDLVICDVSGRNANVMFELGLRLAFDKPVTIIKDELTPFSFDTQSIEHIPYPSGLHYFEIKEFRQRLEKVVNATYNESRKPDYSPFLKDFQIIKRKTISETEVTETQFIIKAIQDLKEEVRVLQSPARFQKNLSDSYNPIVKSSSKNNDVLRFLEFIGEIVGAKTLTEQSSNLNKWEPYVFNLIEDYVVKRSYSIPYSDSQIKDITNFLLKSFSVGLNEQDESKLLKFIKNVLNSH